MDERTRRAMARWPDVPDLYGWLSLDRRGRWRIQGQTISRPHIIETLNRHYAVDARGCWYFQNGPQRGFVALEITPFIATATATGDWVTHTGTELPVPRRLLMDEEGALAMDVDPGAALIEEEDLFGVIDCLIDESGKPLEDDRLALALSQRAGDTGLRWRHASTAVAVIRCDQCDWPEALGFVRTPSAPPNP